MHRCSELDPALHFMEAFKTQRGTCGLCSPQNPDVTSEIAKGLLIPKEGKEVCVSAKETGLLSKNKSVIGFPWNPCSKQ